MSKRNFHVNKIRETHKKVIICAIRRKTTTTVNIEKDDHRIIIRNIPCFECITCGEKVITNDVSGRVEELYQKAKEKPQETVIVEY